MNNPLARLASWHLRHSQPIGFVITAAITVVIGTLITYGVITDYLADAQHERVGRGMDLAIRWVFQTDLLRADRHVK